MSGPPETPRKTRHVVGEGGSLVLENWFRLGIKPTVLQNRMQALHETISKNPHNLKEMQSPVGATADCSSSS